MQGTKGFLRGLQCWGDRGNLNPLREQIRLAHEANMESYEERLGKYEAYTQQTRNFNTYLRSARVMFQDDLGEVQVEAQSSLRCPF